ncbi:hypothetical protein SAMN04488096_105179 [Mesonia phycicola]|uniref:Uncharacterized protein n=1 Tax=Mesonia phycicola TaxID=579105 RepID=A0A1M6ENJ6_9FLAO|nr:hypothetical protein [Mesonia phycicola]SHI87051.1 hypothetical protein SAMN04488096_105179 [Mesonia phycicola]
MKFFSLEYRMKNKWKFFAWELFLYALPLSLFLEWMHADWEIDNTNVVRFLFYFFCFTLFGMLRSYLFLRSRENQLKEWENR